MAAQTSDVVHTRDQNSAKELDGMSVSSLNCEQEVYCLYRQPNTNLHSHVFIVNPRAAFCYQTNENIRPRVTFCRQNKQRTFDE